VATEEQVEHYLKNGLLVEGCGTCEQSLETWRKTGRLPVAPWHRALRSCESGGHPHCTCDACF